MQFRTNPSRASLLALAVAAACAATLPVQATEHKSSKQETIGVTSGLAVGALAGGPFGAVIGAAVGAMLGDHFHRQKLDNAALATDLNEGRLENAKLQASLSELQSRGDKLAQMLEPRRDLETQVTFRTGDALLPAEAALQLQKLGALISSMPNVHVRVSGYADPRGTEAFNHGLSRERADAVAVALMSQAWTRVEWWSRRMVNRRRPAPRVTSTATHSIDAW